METENVLVKKLDGHARNTSNHFTVMQPKKKENQSFLVMMSHHTSYLASSSLHALDNFMIFKRIFNLQKRPKTYCDHNFSQIFLLQFYQN